MSRGAAVIVAFAAAITSAAPLGAQTIIGSRAPVGDAWSETSVDTTVPLVWSSSGGISMGSYQAGASWALVRFFRAVNELPPDARHLRRLPRYALPVVTGASAGNINALLAAIEWCAEQPAGLEESLFWKTWISVGWPQLFRRTDTSEATELGVLGRGFFTDTLYPLIERRLDGSTYGGCGSTALGFTLTRIEPRPFRLNERIAPRTQRFATVLVIEPESRRGPLVFRQPEPRLRSRSVGGMVAPAVANGAVIERSKVFDLLEAASAFPVAFGPRFIAYYDAASLGADGSCPVGAHGTTCATPDSASFADGGIFDNNPLGLALELYRLTQPAETLVVRREALAADTVLVRPGSPTTIYTSMNLVRGPLAGRTSTSTARPRADGLHAALRLLAGAVPAAREYELQTVARALALTGDTLGRRIVATTRAFPMIGEHLGGFAAFLGQPFREYDFLLGVYDGLHLAAESVLCHEVRRLHDPAECTRRELAALTGGEWFELPPLAEQVLSEMYRREHDYEVSIDVTGLGESDVHRVIVLHNVLEANHGHVWRAAVPCTMPDWSRRAVCVNGLDSLLSGLATQQVREIAAQWAEESRSGRCVTVAAEDMGRPACRADREFLQFIADPARLLRGIAWQTGNRLREVEERIGAERKGAPHYASYVELAGYALHTLDARSRRGFYLNNTSVPVHDRSALRLWNLFPDHAAAGIQRYFEYEVGWRPAYHMGERVGDRWAVVMPVSLFWRPSRGLPEGEGMAYPAVGLGVLWKSGWLWLHEVQTSARVNPGTSSVRAELTSEIAAFLLAGKLRLALHSVPLRAEATARRANPRLMLGIADLPGMLYWISR